MDANRERRRSGFNRVRPVVVAARVGSEDQAFIERCGFSVVAADGIRDALAIVEATRAEALLLGFTDALERHRIEDWAIDTRLAGVAIVVLAPPAVGKNVALANLPRATTVTSALECARALLQDIARLRQVPEAPSDAG